MTWQAAAQAVEGRLDLVKRKSETAPQIERSRVVVDTECPDSHRTDYKIAILQTPSGPRMTVLTLLGHLLNFVAPAVTVALLLWGLPRLWPKARRGRWAARTELLALVGLGVVVLLAGLMLFGRDGKMLTYTALVVAQSSLVWWVRER